MRVVRTLLFCLGVLAIALAACGDDAANSVLQPDDLKVPEGEDAKPFDPNKITDLGVLTDIETLKDGADVQKILSRNPYGGRSFLETYQSNGVRASDAISRAARQYRINPLIFLVFAQITEGLLGERNYPFPVERVEYVFRCGCRESTKCLPPNEESTEPRQSEALALAGFDRQVDCLGHALRDSLNQIKETKSKTTSSDWGPDHPSVTLDGIKVTPANEATAVIYDRIPRIAEGGLGGVWVFWNVLNFYSKKLSYSGPANAVDGRWIGEPCVVPGVCGIEGAICGTGKYPGGICTVKCDGQCPTQPGKGDAFCVKFNDGGFCFSRCNETAASCRKGYKCQKLKGFDAAPEGQAVCYPG